MRPLADTNGEFTRLIADNAIDDERVAQIAVTPLVEGASETDARLHRDNPPGPPNLLHH
jgi:hypothetical protein